MTYWHVREVYEETRTQLRHTHYDTQVSGLKGAYKLALLWKQGWLSTTCVYVLGNIRKDRTYLVYCRNTGKLVSTITITVT